MVSAGDTDATVALESCPAEDTVIEEQTQIQGEVLVQTGNVSGGDPNDGIVKRCQVQRVICVDLDTNACDDGLLHALGETRTGGRAAEAAALARAAANFRPAAVAAAEAAAAPAVNTDDVAVNKSQIPDFLAAAASDGMLTAASEEAIPNTTSQDVDQEIVDIQLQVRDLVVEASCNDQLLQGLEHSREKADSDVEEDTSSEDLEDVLYTDSECSFDLTSLDGQLDQSGTGDCADLHEIAARMEVRRVRAHSWDSAGLCKLDDNAQISYAYGTCRDVCCAKECHQPRVSSLQLVEQSVDEVLALEAELQTADRDLAKLEASDLLDTSAENLDDIEMQICLDDTCQTCQHGPR